MVSLNELIEDYDAIVQLWRIQNGKTVKDYPTHEELQEFIATLSPAQGDEDE